MNRLVRIFTLAAVAALTFAFAPFTSEKAAVDVKASKVSWKAYKVTGSHTGNVSLKSGNLELEDGIIKGGAFTLDMTSMTVTDITGSMAEKLLGHLKSDDFFSVEKHKTATFVITKAFPTDTKGNYRIIGDLTIKGITKPIRFNASTTEEDGKIKATAELKLDRTDFDVRYRSGSFFDGLGDKTIYDEFDMTVSLVAAK